MSKRSMWDWFHRTVLLRVFSDANKSALSSQRFWDNMSTVKEDKLQVICVLSASLRSPKKFSHPAIFLVQISRAQRSNAFFFA